MLLNGPQDEINAERLRPGTPFNLVRFYLLTVVFVVVLSSSALWLYHSVEVRQLIHLSEEHSGRLAQPVASAVWSRFSGFLAAASDLNPAALEVRPEMGEIAAAIEQIISGLGIIKVKIYNLDGITVFSTDPIEIGENQRHNPGFKEAVASREPVSKLTFEGTENSFERKLTNIDVVETYLPIKSASGRVEGVVETYMDVSSLLAMINRSARYLGIGFLLFCVVIYGTIYFVVRRADRVIWAQYADISNQNAALEQAITVRERAERSLQRAHDDLEEQVKARTHQLSEQIKERERIEDEAQRHREELIRAGAVITIGEMATTLAHELNQPLTVITGCAQLALGEVRGQGRGQDRGQVRGPANSEGQLDKDEAMQAVADALAQIAEQADRANRIVAQVRGFVGKRGPVREPTDISALITDLGDLLQAACREQDVAIDFALAADLPPVLVDPIQIQQVVLNLVYNAIEAMAAMQPGEKRVLIEASRAEGGSIEVAVHDAGPGVPDEAREDVFRAFYTTKPSGLGLGLSISHSIVEAHGGHLDAVGGRLGGAKFGFTFPVTCIAAPVFADG